MKLLLNAQKTPHLGWLDQIRGAAALYVVCHHAVMQVTVIGDHAHDNLYRLLQLATGYGHYAVDIFIVLSGYCLMLPLLKTQKFGNIWRFYLRRTVRIVLPYYLALITTLLLIYFFIGDTDHSAWANVSLPVSADSLLKHIVLIHQWFPDAASKINGAFWSVGVEYQIYFIFPLLYFSAKKIGYIKTGLFVTLLAYALWGLSAYFQVMNPDANGNSVYYCSLFFMGMMAAKFVKAATNPETQYYALTGWIYQYSLVLAITAFAGLVIVAISGFLYAQALLPIFFPLQIQSFFIGLFFALLLYLRGCDIPGSMQATAVLVPSCMQNFLQSVGKFGFSLYLLHDPLIAIVWSHLIAPMHLPYYWLQAITELLIGGMVSLLLAWIFYQLVELPCHQLSKSIASG